MNVPLTWLTFCPSLLGEQLRFYHPFVYHWSPPSAAATWIHAVPNLVAVAGGDHVTRPPWFRSLTLFSSNQLAVTSFAKARQYGLGKHGRHNKWLLHEGGERVCLCVKS